ncbi:MAG: methionine adenosyltransferase [bacterium]|nr:methionine adenosyltransferase [bacterium]
MGSRIWSFTSESVAEGHPDKVADLIADRILDAVMETFPGFPRPRVACEVLVTGSRVILAGETSHGLDDGVVEHTARQAISDAGYGPGDPEFPCDGVEVINLIQPQSQEISDMVVGAEIGAGDQGIIFGFACDETSPLMPLPIHLAHQLARRLAEARRLGIIDYLRPDGKTQVTVEYHGRSPARVTQVVVSAHHQQDVDYQTLREDIEREVILPVVPADLLGEDTRFLINHSGSFVSGGPAADTGLTGRKLVVDTYGGYGPHGGGALSGKDPTKVDRSASYAARHAAKNLVAAGLARQCSLQLSYVIGMHEPLSLHVDCYGTNTAPLESLEKALGAALSFRPERMIEDLGLWDLRFSDTTLYGHFGREDAGFAWEKTDLAERLRAEALSL